MKLAYMKKMDRIIRLAGTRDPDEILACILDSRKHDDAIVEKNAVNAENSLF